MKVCICKPTSRKHHIHESGMIHFYPAHITYPDRYCLWCERDFVDGDCFVEYMALGIFGHLDCVYEDAKRKGFYARRAKPPKEHTNE